MVVQAVELPGCLGKAIKCIVFYVSNSLLLLGYDFGLVTLFKG